MGIAKVCFNIWVHNAMYVCILGFCSMMNVYKIINYLGVRICQLPSIMGKVPKSHSIHVQNPTKSPFLNKDLVWRSEICHGGKNKVTIQFAYVPYARISRRWMKGYKHLCGMEYLQKNFKPNRCQATNYQKPLWAYVLNIYGINPFSYGLN